MCSPLNVLPLHLACQLLASQNSSFAIVKNTSTQLPKSATEIPSGYILLPEIGVAYKYHNYKVQWNVARKYCVAEGGNLAITDTYQKYQSVLDLDKSGSHVHVGFHKLFDSTEWTNLKTGLPAIVIPWRYEAWHGADRQCAAADKDRNGVIAIKYSPLPKLATELPSGYTVFPDAGVAYKYFKNPMPWNAARKYCDTYGGNLAVINSFEKIEYVRSINTGSSNVHVGIHRFFDSNEWTDIKDGLLATAIPWRVQTYETEIARQCMGLVGTGDVGLFAVKCSERMSSVCEVTIFKK